MNFVIKPTIVQLLTVSLGLHSFNILCSSEVAIIQRHQSLKHVANVGTSYLSHETKRIIY